MIPAPWDGPSEPARPRARSLKLVPEPGAVGGNATARDRHSLTHRLPRRNHENTT